MGNNKPPTRNMTFHAHCGTFTALPRIWLKRARRRKREMTNELEISSSVTYGHMEEMMPSCSRATD